MRVLLVEDEKPAADRLQTILHRYDPSIEISAVCESIEQTTQYLETHPHPDLMLLDIHLSDGPGFEVLRKLQYRKPVIITTAYDEYAIQSFQYCSIDYILKPVTL